MGIPKGDKVLDLQELFHVQIQKIGRGNREFWNIEGKEHPAFDKVGEVKVSDIGPGHLYYPAEDGGKKLWVIDGVAGPGFDEQVLCKEPQFRAGHWFYRIKVGSKEHVVLDGELHPGHTETWGLQFENGHISYVYRDGKQHFLWLDGELHGPYGEVYSPRWSDDGRPWYQAGAGGKKFYVVDGVELDRHDEVYAAGCKDDWIWYLARDGKAWFYWINGLKGPDFSVKPSGFVSGPTFWGNHFAYYCEDEKGQMVVTDRLVFRPEAGAEVHKYSFPEGKLVVSVRKQDCDRLYIENVPLEEAFSPGTLWFEEADGELRYGGKVRRTLKLT